MTLETAGGEDRKWGEQDRQYPNNGDERGDALSPSLDEPGGTCREDGPIPAPECDESVQEESDGENLIPAGVSEESAEPTEDSSSRPAGGLVNDPWEFDESCRSLNLKARRKGGPLRKKGSKKKIFYTGKQRILIIDTLRRSGLPIKDFAPLVGMSPHTLYKWRKIYEEGGLPALLGESSRGQKQSRLPEVTKRAILMLKEDNPEWGVLRISDMLARGQGIGASPGAVNRVLHEAGYEVEHTPSRQHRPLVHRFERSKPNQMWQTDLFTFMLKRQNRRVYLVGFMDDHSRFIVGWGLHAGSSSAMVIDTLKTAIANYQAPGEILTDNGPQYVSWRGKSQFTKTMEKLGIRQIVARPKHPRTLGKIERFWGTLWRELVETTVFLDVEDARNRIGHFIDYYNFQRTHSGFKYPDGTPQKGLVPADRFFGAAPEMLRSLKERVKENALALAKRGSQPKPFYLTGQAGGKNFSVHTRGDKVILHRAGEGEQEVDLAEVGEALPEPVSQGARLSHSDPEDPEREPGWSPLDEGLRAVKEALDEKEPLVVPDTPEPSGIPEEHGGEA